MSNFLRKTNRKNDKLVSKKYATQSSKISDLFGASDDEIDDFFDNHFDENLYEKIIPIKNKAHRKKSKNESNYLKQNNFVDEKYLSHFSDCFFYCTRKFIVTCEVLNNGSKRYFFTIENTKPYLRRRFDVIRQDTALNKAKNKIVFDALKKKNLYYLKKPFLELLKYIAPISLRVLMSTVHTGDRLYIRSSIEFYLKKYFIEFDRYKDNSSDRVRKYRKSKIMPIITE